jgi:glycerol-3-phosphate cytidylyltransferase-like family protein
MRSSTEPAAHACGAHANGYGTGASSAKSAEQLRHALQVEVQTRLEHRLLNQHRFVDEAMPGEPLSDERVVVRAHGAGVVTHRVVPRHTRSNYMRSPPAAEIFNEEVNRIKRKIKASVTRIDDLSVAFDYNGEVTATDAQEVLDKSSRFTLVRYRPPAKKSGRVG